MVRTTHPTKIVRLIKFRSKPPLSLELLHKLAAQAPPEAPVGSRHSPQGRQQFELEQWLGEHFADLIGPHPWQSGSKWIFPICPWNPEHTNKSAFVIQFASGAIAARCHHNGCSGKDWHALRDVAEPGWRARGGPSVGFGSALSDESGENPPWPEPGELPGGLLPVSNMPEEMIPTPFRAWLGDIAERMQCPLEFLAVGALVSSGSLVGRRIGIRPKQHDDWLVIPNLWGAVIGRPGILKSPALAEVLKPLHRLEKFAQQEYETALKEYEKRKIVLKAKRDDLDRRVRDALKKGEDPEDIIDSTTLPGEEPPVLVRYIVNDSTVEKLGEIFKQNPRGVLLFRDELTGLLRTLDRDGHEGDRACYLEAWSGDGSFTYDRIGRGTIRIPAVCLSLLGGIQPGPLADYLQAAVRGGSGDDGLMQRFQLAVYPDDPGSWRNVDRWPDTQAKNQAFEIFHKLDVLDPFVVGADIEDREDIPFLHFTPAAQGLFDEWRAGLETRIRSREDHPAVEAHLAKYRSLMPSLALLFHLLEVVDGLASGPVSEPAALLAVQWCQLLEAHARKIYHVVTGHSLLVVRALAKRIKEGELPSPFFVRDVYRSGWAALSDPDEVKAAAEVLEDLGWIRSERVLTAGRPRFQYHLNPHLSRKERAA
jgi:hypothetical protein